MPKGKYWNVKEEKNEIWKVKEKKNTRTTPKLKRNLARTMPSIRKKSTLSKKTSQRFPQQILMHIPSTFKKCMFKNLRENPSSIFFVLHRTCEGVYQWSQNEFTRLSEYGHSDFKGNSSDFMREPWLGSLEKTHQISWKKYAKVLQIKLSRIFHWLIIELSKNAVKVLKINLSKTILVII